MDKKDKSLYKFRQAVYAISALLIIILVIIVPTGFGMLNLGWATSIVSALLLIILFVLNLYSEFPARFLKRLKFDLFIPAFREVINHQKNLYQCRLILRNMEYTLAFYRLWPLIELLPAEDEKDFPIDQRSKFRRWLSGLKDAITWKKLHDWLLKDPLEKEQALPDHIAHHLLNAATEQERIKWCSVETAKYLKMQLARKISVQAASPSKKDSKQEVVDVERQLQEAMIDHELGSLFQLLYQEHHGPNTRTLWDEVKEKEYFVNDLAALLLWSRQLPEPEKDLPLTSDDLITLLLSLEDLFTLPKLKAAIFNRQEQRRRYRFVVDRMAYTMEYFHLFKQMTKEEKPFPTSGMNTGLIQPPYYTTDPTGKDGFTPQLRRKLIDEPAGTNQGEYLDDCAERVAMYFTDPSPQVMTGVLKLLYRELYGPAEAKQEIWVTQKGSSNFLTGLSKVLLRGANLPDKEKEEPYSCEELSRLLNEIENFSLERLKADISSDQKKRFKTRFEISRLEHTLNFYNLFHLFDDQIVEQVNKGSTHRFKEHFQNKLVDHSIQSIHEPGEQLWIDDFVQGVLSEISPAKIEALSSKINSLEREPSLSKYAVKTQVFQADLEPHTPTMEEFLAEFKTIIELIYCEQHGLATDVLWDKAFNNDHVLLGLAQLLIDSGRLPTGDKDLSYGPVELIELMKKLDTFDLDRTRTLVLSDLERRRKNREVAEKLMSVLQYYNLYPILQKDIRKTSQGRESFSDSFCRYLIDKPPAFHTEMDQVDDFVRRLEQYMQPAKLEDTSRVGLRSGQAKNGDSMQTSPKLDSASLKDVLAFLYWKYHKGETQEHWQEIRMDNNSLHSLVAVMLHSNLLPVREGYFPYSSADVEHIFAQLDNFDISQAEDQLDGLNEIWQYALSYQEFLHKNDISCLAPTSGDLLNQVHLPLTPGTMIREIQNFLMWQGLKAIIHHYDELPDIRIKGRTKKQYLLEHVNPKSSGSAELLECLSLISLIVFVTEKVTESLRLRERPCLLAAQKDKALLIISAYLEFRKYLRIEDKIGGKDFVSIDYLARHWAENIATDQAKPIGYQDELETIRTALQDGKWPRRVREVLSETLENIGQKHQEINQKLEKLAARSEVLRKVLEAAFRKLTTQTIERYLDARKQIAYLLTFRVESGTLATLLDLLVGKNEEEKKLRNRGTQIGVDFFLPNGKRKYNFGQFCPFARIGVVPTGMAFDEFFDEFQHDFGKVVDARNKLLSQRDISNNLHLLNDIEVIMSRFGLAGQNYFSFKKEKIVHDKAIDKVRELLPYELEIKDMTEVIEYQEENILEFILQLPIKELVVCQISLTDQEAEALESKDGFIKDSLVKKYGLLTIHDFAKACLDRTTRAKAKSDLFKLLIPVLVEAGDKRCKKIADVYINTLTAIGEIL